LAVVVPPQITLKKLIARLRGGKGPAKEGKGKEEREREGR